MIVNFCAKEQSICKIDVSMLLRFCLKNVSLMLGMLSRCYQRLNPHALKSQKLFRNRSFDRIFH